MVWLIGPSEPVNPGDDILVRFYAQDNRAIETLVIRVSGAFELEASFAFPEPRGQFTTYVTIPVPEGARLDVPAIVSLTVADRAGLTAEGSTSAQLVDTRGPMAFLDFGGLHPDETIRSGETLQIFVNAADNHRLTYIGYDGAGLRDSVPATSIGDSHVFELTVPRSWVLNRPQLTAWARDASGHVSAAREHNTQDVPVYDWTHHPVATVPLLPDAAPDVLWDAKRSLLYRLRNSSDTSGAIDEIDVRSGLPPVTIDLPGYASDFAFSVSGDSLVVSLPAKRALGVVDLVAPLRTSTVVPLLYDGEANRLPWALQTSGQHLFVALTTLSTWGQLLDVNLGTGAQVIRTDIDGASRVGPVPVLLPLPDGRLFVSSDVGYPCDECFLYAPDSDRFTRTSRLGSVDQRYFATSPSGRFFAVGGTVFDAALDSVASAPTWDWNYPPIMALSHDDQAVYQSTWYGYQKVRLSDGLLLEQVKLGMRPFHLLASADGSRLIAVGESVVMIVDVR